MTASPATSAAPAAMPLFTPVLKFSGGEFYFKDSGTSPWVQVSLTNVNIKSKTYGDWEFDLSIVDGRGQVLCLSPYGNELRSTKHLNEGQMLVLDADGAVQVFN